MSHHKFVLQSNKFSPFLSRFKPSVLDQQHIPAGGEERGWGLPAALPAHQPGRHRPGPPHGQRHQRATGHELHRGPAPWHLHPQPAPGLQRWLCLHGQGQRSGEDVQGLFHQRHSEWDMCACQECCGYLKGFYEGFQFDPHLLLQSFVSLLTSSWRLMSTCASLGRSWRFAAPPTTPTSTTTSPGNPQLSRSVARTLGPFLNLAVIIDFNFLISFCLQKPTIEERVRSSGENRLDIQSILTISCVDLADTGNISCIGTNEAGVNSSTTYLFVVGKTQKQAHMQRLILKRSEHVSGTDEWQQADSMYLDSSEQTNPTSGCCPSCPLNCPVRVSWWRWTREKIWSSPCSSRRILTS